MTLNRSLPYLFLFLLWISTGTVFADSQKTQSEPELEPVTLQLKWLHQFQFAGYYAAKIKGFYKEEGLDVEIKQRDIYQNNIQQVIDGEAEYGVSDSILMLYQARNEPVVIVSPIFQHSPQVLITLTSSGIDSPYKLEDKKIAFYLEDIDGFPLLAMFENLGIKPNYERMVNKADPESLIRGENDAYSGYVSNEPYVIRKAGVDVNVIRPINYGIDFYGDMLFTNANEVKNHPERVERFKKASLKGWQYALNHKNEMAQYIQKELNSDKTLEHLLYEANVIEEMMSVNSVPIGTLDIGRLQFMEDLFRKHGLIKNRLKLEDGIFSPEKKTIEYSKKELEWIKQNPTVRVAVDRAWAPIEFVDKNGEFKGISSDYLNYLTKRTGIEFLPAKDLSWTQAVKQMKSQQLDMFSAVIETPERSQYTRYTQAYLEFPMVIATQKGEPFISDMKQLNKQIVAVVEGYASEEKMKTNYPNIALLLVNTPKEGLEAVAKGKAYAYVDNIAAISHLIQSNHLSNIQITGETPFKADISMAIRSDWPELQSIIQKTLLGMNETTKNQLTEPWLQVTYKKEFEWQTLLIIVVPLGLALLIFLLYNRRLKGINGRLLQVQNRLNQSNKKLEQLSVTDHLTQSYNRSYIDALMKKEIHSADRYKTPLTLLLFDLDNFKNINDTYGHIVGDEVLVKSVDWIQMAIRGSDTFGRWGGEEFVLVCPNTNLQQAQQIAEKLRQGIESLSFSRDFKQTVSIGLARHHNKQSIEHWISKADSALYQAKHQGKNQVVCNQDPLEILDDRYLS